MLYILLIIIAIGVLLASEAGTKLLKLFIILIALASVSLLIILLIAGGIILVQNKTVVSYIGTAMLFCGAIYGLYESYKKYRQKELKIYILGTIDKIFPQGNEFKKYKKTTIFIVLAYTYLVVMIIYGIFS